MKLREIKINNFRCFRDVSISLEDTTVFIGENNSGKTALLEAIRIPLTRSTLGKGTIFNDYDFSMINAGDTPNSCNGILIELWFREDHPDEWPDNIIQVLNEIIQTDVETDIDSIGYRITSKFDPEGMEIEDKIEFLALDGQPLGGRAANPSNVSRFLRYIKVFYLSALRDSQDEFSSKSHYWGRILKNLNISQEQLDEINKSLEKLNDGLIKADARLEKVRTTLEEAQKIMGMDTGQSTTIQALPMKPWELMSKSELVIKPKGSDINFPLSHHGQGTQSLAVLFLFQAYIDVLLKPNFEEETEAIIALEEPESHLHPQACRALASNLLKFSGQIFISSHSPYFIQEIPFSQIRMFSRIGKASQIYSIKRYFSVVVPHVDKLDKFCESSGGKLVYKKSISALLAYGTIDEKEYRKLIQIYALDKESISHIKEFYKESQSYISDKELADLNTYAKRVRGEILFAKGWILCEGPSDYLLLKHFAEMLNKPLDFYGISVIDFKNNGSEGPFVSLSIAFNIPFVMLCDNDAAGKGYFKTVLSKGINEDDANEFVYLYPEEGMDIELFLVKNGFCDLYMDVLKNHGISISSQQGSNEYYDEIADFLRKNKTEYSLELINMMKTQNFDEQKVPEFIKQLILSIVERVNHRG